MTVGRKLVSKVVICAVFDVNEVEVEAGDVAEVVEEAVVNASVVVETSTVVGVKDGDAVLEGSTHE